MKSAEAKLREARLNLGYTRVVAPISGMSSRAPKSEGSLVAAGTDLLTTISQIDPVWVQFSISENEKLRVERAVAEKKLEWPSNDAMDVAVKLADGTTLQRKGKINFADTRINTGPAPYETRAEFRNADSALKSGPVRARDPQRAEAPQRDRRAAGRGARRAAGQVRLRRRQGQGWQGRRAAAAGDARRLGRPARRNLWIVESGLAPGDKVIVDGIAQDLHAGRADQARRRSARCRRRAAGAARQLHPAVAPAAERAQEISAGATAHVLALFHRPPDLRDRHLDLPRARRPCRRCATLPIAQYPEIAPPVVTVSAVYPGASAEVLEQTVAAPLENAINGVPNMLYMSSNSSSQGVVQIQVTFEIGTNVDDAAINVNNRVKQVEPRLPQEVRRQGVNVERGSSAFLQVLAFYAPDGRFDDLFTSNYVTLNVLDQLKRLPGTTNVQIFGAHDYAMRIWLKPDRLAQLKLTPIDVITAVNEQNAQFAAGKVGQAPHFNNQDLVYTITTKGRLADAKEFEQIIVRANPDGSYVRLADVARVELGSKDYEFLGRFNGKPATLVGIFLSPGANALAVAKTVKATLAELETRFPAGFTYAIPYDTTRFVEVSIREVLYTLAEAMVLVFLVVFLFLQNWRATIIPTIAVPVSLTGTFAGLYLLGYSINTLTLFGMVLSIGIVVDDAIVVLENVERHMREDHLDARSAAIKAMGEVTGPVIAIVLVLTAVFVPIAFLGGLTGELYRQFAVTISIAVVISGVIALTLTARAVRDDPEARAPCAGTLLHGVQPRLRAHDARLHERRRLHAAPRLHRRDPVRADGGLARVPLAHHAGQPRARRGPGLLHLRGDPARRRHARAHATRWSSRSRRRCAPIPNNQDIVAFTGFDFIGGGFRNNAATIFVTQKPWDERKVTAPQLVGELFGKTAGIKEALVLAFNPPPIFGLGTAGGFEFYIQNRGDGGAKRLDQVKNAVPGAREPGPAAGRRADALARRRAAAHRRRRPREGQEARRADRRSLQHARGHARHVLRERLQQVRAHLAGADVGRGAVSHAPRRHRLASTCARPRARCCRCPRSRRCATRPAPTRSTASTTCRRSRSSAAARRA